ncbi:unknown [Bacteroides sp. CAG:875]|nr:unknown [Bacteroides sp. CAG:875]
MNIPMAILRGVEISFPLLEREPKIIMIIGVNVITKKGFTACHISGAIVDVSTKSLAKSESEVPF